MPAQTAAATRRVTVRVASWPEVLAAMSSLRDAVREVRRHKRMSLRRVSAQSGVAFSCLHRFEQGGDIKLTSALALMGWLCRGEDGQDNDGEGT